MGAIVTRMGFRFRRSIKVLPGVHLNLSKTGITASIGSPGATINIGSKDGAIEAGFCRLNWSDPAGVGPSGRIFRMGAFLGERSKTEAVGRVFASGSTDSDSANSPYQGLFFRLGWGD